MAHQKPPSDVQEVFDAYPLELRKPLLKLRSLILEVASETEGVGRVEEVLRWGQPSFITPETKSGSIVRIDRIKNEEQKYAMYFHCQTDLVDGFRSIYPDSFEFEGKRAIIFSTDESLPEDALRHCVSLALTYKMNKQKV